MPALQIMMYSACNAPPAEDCYSRDILAFFCTATCGSPGGRLPEEIFRTMHAQEHDLLAGWKERV
jgi:hypothetical protein